MPDVWYENPPGSAPAQGLYSHAGLSRGGTIAFIAGQLSVRADGEVRFTTYFTRSEDINKFMVPRRQPFPKLFGSEDYPPNTRLIVSRP